MHQAPIRCPQQDEQSGTEQKSKSQLPGANAPELVMFLGKRAPLCHTGLRRSASSTGHEGTSAVDLVKAAVDWHGRCVVCF